MFSGRFPCVFADLEGWLTKLLDFYSYERLRHSFKNEFILRKGASNHTNDVQRQRFRKRSEAFFPPWVFSWLQAGGSSVGQTPLDFKDRRATGKLRVNLLGRNTSTQPLWWWHRQGTAAWVGVQGRRSESTLQHLQAWSQVIGIVGTAIQFNWAAFIQGQVSCNICELLEQRQSRGSVSEHRRHSRRDNSLYWWGQLYHSDSSRILLLCEQEGEAAQHPREQRAEP